METEQTIDTLATMLADLQRKYDHLESENDELNEKLEWESDWTMLREPKQDSFNLPVPRLELRAHYRDGSYEYRWLYSLVYTHLMGNQVQVPLGMTRVGSSTGPTASKAGIEEPFRESAHIRSEMKDLNLPGFVVCGDFAVEINSENRDQIPVN